MNLIVIDETTHKIDKKSFYDPALKDKIVLIDGKDKKETLLTLIKAYYSDAKIILYDSSNKLIEKRVKNRDFDLDNFKMLFFTSGTTGVPTGAFKTKANLEKEVETLAKLIKKQKIKKAIVTVPFIHIYGVLVGLLLPLKLNIDILVKRELFPHALVDLITPNTLIITTPLYLKSLNRLNKRVDFSTSLFISSTSPLQDSDRDEFVERFNTTVLQLFGSTETGGIGYRFNKDREWSRLDKVEIRVDENSLLEVKSPYISQNILKQKIVKSSEFYKTFDFIEITKDKFNLIGRDSQIIKVAGKRYSVAQIENILENEADIKKALIKIKRDNNSLKDEILELFLQTNREYSKKEIQNIIYRSISTTKFSIELNFVDNIQTTVVGKLKLL